MTDHDLQQVNARRRPGEGATSLPSASPDGDLDLEQNSFSREGAPDTVRRLGPDTFGRHPVQSAAAALGGFSEGAPCALRGRLTSRRELGKLIFAHLTDASGSLQIFADPKSPAFAQLKAAALGDIAAAAGCLQTTRRGEPSLYVEDFERVAACRSLLPDKRQGIADQGQRIRRRAVDLVVNRSSFDFFRRSSLFTAGLREALGQEGFLEFDTGVVQSRFDAGYAKPFVTRVNTTQHEGYLRLTSELRLKELIISGFEAVYELGKSFRNEGMNKVYHPEFTLLEAYRAYAGCEDMCDLVERMVRRGLMRGWGGTQVVLPRAGEVDFSRPWERITYEEALRRFTDLPLHAGSGAAEIITALDGAEGFTADMHYRLLVEKIISKFIVPRLLAPAFLTDLPAGMSPLIAAKAEQPHLSDRAWAVIDGVFLGDIYRDLLDPQKLRAALEAQAASTGRPVNQSFLEALELGLPPTAGIGISVNRLLLPFRGGDLSEDILETILYPINV